MATTNMSRFYLTDIRVRIASSEIEGTRRNYQERVDPIPPPSRHPAPPPVKVCPPMPRPPPACPPAKVCPPATATVCPPPITKVQVSGILRNIPYQKAGVSGLNLDISILLPAGTNPTLRFKVADLQSSYPNVFERITGGGGRKHKTKKLRNYKGGQSCVLNPDSKIDSSIYLFRPSTFKLDESRNSVYLPVYFDYYAYLRKNFAYISRVLENQINPLLIPTPNHIIMGIDRLLSCSFILDQYNIPYYITRIKVSDRDTYYAIVKKCNPNANYSNTALNNNSFFKLEINFKTDLIMQMVDTIIGFATYDYKDGINNELNYRTDQIKLQSIPDDIGFPNITNSRARLVKDLTAPTGLQPPRMALGYELLPGTILPPPAPYPAPSVELPPASPPR